MLWVVMVLLRLRLLLRLMFVALRIGLGIRIILWRRVLMLTGAWLVSSVLLVRLCLVFMCVVCGMRCRRVISMRWRRCVWVLFVIVIIGRFRGMRRRCRCVMNRLRVVLRSRLRLFLVLRVLFSVSVRVLLRVMIVMVVLTLRRLLRCVIVLMRMRVSVLRGRRRTFLVVSGLI